jgi:type IV fimbrial biogenesis protein FimT
MIKNDRVGSTRSSTAGFTLIELAITLVIVGILLSLAMPSFTSMLENSRIKSAASGFAAGLQTARAHAITKNLTTVFTLNGAGWSISDGGSIDSKSPDEGGSNKLQFSTTPTGIVTVSFNGFGAATFGGAAAIANPAIFSFSSANNTCIANGGTARCIDVRVTPAGQVRVCDPSITAAGDTRKC